MPYTMNPVLLAVFLLLTLHLEINTYDKWRG